MRFIIVALLATATSVLADSCKCNTQKAMGYGGCDWDTDNDSCYACIGDGELWGTGKAPDCRHTISWSCGFGCDGTCQQVTCI